MNNYLEELAVKNSNRANELGIENMKLKKRIDKAIEYIEKTDTFQIVHSTDELAEMLRKKTIKDLINILKGEENE